mgnify:CR=1 FL=1
MIALFDEMIETFIEETKDNLEVMEEGLLELEKNPDDIEVINSVFRAMHTIKGGAGLMGLEEMSNLAHVLENVLDDMREKKTAFTEEISSILFNGYDLLQKMVIDGDLHGETIRDDIEELKNKLQASGSTEKTANKAVPEMKEDEKLSYFKIHLSFLPQIFETGTDPSMLITELQDVGNVLFTVAHTKQLPPLSSLNPQELHLSWTVFLETKAPREKIENIFIFVIDENDITINDITLEAEKWFSGSNEAKEMLSEYEYFSDEEIEATLEKLKEIGQKLQKENKLSFANKANRETKQQSNGSAKNERKNNTIRVDTEKLEKILNELAELLIAQSRVKDLVLNGVLQNNSTQQYREVLNAFNDVDKIIRNVQEEVMNTSMIPIGSTFMRFQRMVRDMAKEKGKQIELIINGKETELDKQVIEQITDPLKHLLRNSVDHGIEEPEERVRKGKDPTGIITLSAYHQEGSIIIEVTDDGKGIDEALILKKAIEKGFVSPDQTLTKQEIYDLLFKAGFSTAKQVTDISGRGVGMDVVLTNIRNLRGSVHIDSEKDKGTRIKIQLPLTLAIIDGMMIKVGEERFIVPLNVIIEFIKATEDQIHQAEGKGTLVHLRDEYIPYIGLYELLNIETANKKPTDGIIIIIQNNQRKLALLVDDILGQEQVVIKSIKENMNQVDGVAGATILGDGNVALILDIPSLFSAFQKMQRKEQLA